MEALESAYTSLPGAEAIKAHSELAGIIANLIPIGFNRFALLFENCLGFPFRKLEVRRGNNCRCPSSQCRLALTKIRSGGRPDTPAQATGRRVPRIIPRGCHLPATHPAAASWPHYLPAPPCAARKPVHGSPRHAGRVRERGHSGTRGAWTSRKPLLLLRFDGLFLLRLAERRFRGLLFQEPPRTTARTSTGSRPAHIRWNTTPASICSNRASQSA